MKYLIPVLAFSLVAMVGVSSSLAQNYSRSSQQTWSSSYNSATDSAPRTSYTNSESGWGKVPSQPFRATDSGGFNGWGSTSGPFNFGFHTQPAPNLGFRGFAPIQVPDFVNAGWMSGSMDSSSWNFGDRKLFAWSNVGVERVLENISRMSADDIRVSQKAWKQIQDSNKTISRRFSNVSIKRVLAAVSKELGLVVSQRNDAVVISAENESTRKLETLPLRDLVRPLSFNLGLQIPNPIRGRPLENTFGSQFQFHFPATRGFAR